MSNAQFYVAVGVPTFMVLITFLLNMVQISGIRSEMAALREDMRGLREEMRDLRAEIRDLVGAVHGLETRVALLEHNGEMKR